MEDLITQIKQARMNNNLELYKELVAQIEDPEVRAEYEKVLQPRKTFRNPTGIYKYERS